VQDVLILLGQFGNACAAAPSGPAPGTVVARGATLATGAAHSVPRSQSLEVLTVVKTSNTSQWSIPCARSYGGYDWEVVKPREGHPSGLVHVVSCSSGGPCHVTIPNDPNHVYVLKSRVLSPGRHDAHTRSAARLMLQATFGPSHASLAELATFPSEEAWVLDQIENKPPTLHREYFRQRANPRLEAVTQVARPRGACEPKSRWNRIAIRADDINKNISFSAVPIPGGGGNVTAMYVGGVLRSEVNLTDMRPFGLGSPVRNRPNPATDNCAYCQQGGLSLDTNYVICRISEWPMGMVAIGTSCQEQIFPGATNRVELYNVLMKFTQLAYPTTDYVGEPIDIATVQPGDAVVQALPTTIYNAGVLILSHWNIACPFSRPGAQVHSATTISYMGEYYRYDPRAALMENTLQRPANMSSTTLSGQPRTCPMIQASAPKTFLNEHTCVISNGCEPDEFTDTSFELNATTLRKFFTAGKNYVYAVDSLPLSSAVNPCKKLARWRAIGPCAGRATATLSTSTRTVLTNAINSSTDTNPYVKDVELSRALQNSCSNANGAIIDVGGQCWQHVHNDQLSVYDFTFWSTGSRYEDNRETAGFFPIQSNIIGNTDGIWHFPSWKPESLWTRNANAAHTALKASIGRLGDRVSYRDLPRRLQSTGFAEAMGVGISPTAKVAGVEMCGSPGEASNDPTLGNRFYIGKQTYDACCGQTQQEMLSNFREATKPQKQTIHASIAFSGQDQLRQRVAWALSSTFVLGPVGSAVLSDHTEVWTSYYDIFVRHAFGSYRDIMREVSFSPLMGWYLTYKDSASFSYKGSVPDENYAREIMQLFSIGLYELNDDGTQKLDANSQPIPTYTNDNIIEFAKLWTGFRLRPVRGNIEEKRISNSNQLDPMVVVAIRRDSTPKMDLHHGHIGDSYPLCTDLPPQSFLRKGAKFRFLGSSGVGDHIPGSERWNFSDVGEVNEPLFTPDSSTSALYATLCNGDAVTGRCQFQSVVKLNANIACDGAECSLETLRIIKIRVNGSSTPFYYEYIQVPCVSLAFFVGAHGGNYIENIYHVPTHGNQDELIERVCADPKAQVAAPACCTASTTNVRHCFEYRCGYVEERVSLSKALQRCNTSALRASYANPPAVPTGEMALWSLYPEAYRTEPTECPGNSSTANESFCMQAATAAMAATGEPHFNSPRFSNLRAGSWNNKPSGCQVDDRAIVYFNRRANGAGDPVTKLVCKDLHPSAVPDLSNASHLLCTRKRRKCWWNSRDNCQQDYGHALDRLTTNMYWWTETPCHLQAQVNIDGRVSVVHPGSESVRRVGVNSDNWFRVRWHAGHFPAAASNCGGTGTTCSVVAGETGDTCLCDIEMTTSAVFTDATRVPSQAEVEEQLRIGAPSPDQFDSGTYSLCNTTVCQARAPLVQVYTRGGAGTPRLDDTAIFVISVNKTGISAASGRIMYLANKQSVVSVASSGGEGTPPAFSFRNPPQFMTITDPSQRDALYETEALLDHLSHHSNVPPFVATMLIKMLVTSNPSPRYVQVVATAFKTGVYHGHTFSGTYGDIGAATAATLLDREARSLVLSADPTFGGVRAPFLKLMHLLRAMEYTPRDHREIEFTQELSLEIGQAVYQSPSVFSFFLPDFISEGAVESSGLVAPEAQLATLPNLIGLLDGVSTLVFDGLTHCAGGFGPTGTCNRFAVSRSPRSTSTRGNTGHLSFTPANVSSAESVIDELDLLLTGGRLDFHSYAVVKSEYERALNVSSCPVDRSAQLCGRLTPGDRLWPGEQLTNAQGEVLCFTYDGVARHIGADGREVFSSEDETRGGGEPLRYDVLGNGNSLVSIAGWVSATHLPQGRRMNQRKWSTLDYAEGGIPNAFHSFLAGPCPLLDADVLRRVNEHGYTSFGGSTTIITCNATSTCAAAGAPAPSPPAPRSAAYNAARARTDAEHAVRVAQNLMVATTEFSITNDPATTNVSAPVPTPRTRRNHGFKALVILYMNGGADTFNLLVPHSNCDSRNASGWYTRTRSIGALDLNRVLPISSNGTQQCGTMGIHPRFSTLQQLYNDGDAAFVANVGALVQPTTKQEIVDRTAVRPAGLFAHNLQTQGAKTLHPQSTSGGTGVLGRICKAFEDQAAATGGQPIKASAYSITDDRTMFRGSPIEPVLLSAHEGMMTYDGTATAARAFNNAERTEHIDAYQRLVSQKSESIFADTHADAFRSALVDSERIEQLMANVSLTQNWETFKGRASAGHGKSFVAQLQQVASVISARQAFDAEVDVFYVEMPGFDTHSDAYAVTDTKFNDINIGLDAFVREMKAQGVWNQVAVQSLSEFGRTMTSNGLGTDHAWGGNHFLLGGDVKGGTIHGEYPVPRPDGPQSVSSTGQMLPSSPWEAIWKPLAEWIGVEQSQLDTVMPNLHKFPASTYLLNSSHVFHSL
jgi:uncharacterized protein (DUF1501 family)/uncharacterized protein (DUF1800 family)